MSGRLLLTLVTVAFAAIVYLLMLRGWRSRQRRQGDLPPPPAAPADRGTVLVGGVPGLFVGTTTDAHWLDRVAVHSLSDRAVGWLLLTAAGVVIEREGLADLFLPWDAVLAAAPGDALAGKVMGRDGLLLVTWRLGARTLVSGFRAEDHAEHRRLADAISGRLPVREAS